MLEDFYIKPTTCDRIRTSWIAPQIEGYVAWLKMEGYRWQSVRHRVPTLVEFGEFAKSRGATTTTELPSYVADFVEQRVRVRGSGRSQSRKRQIRNETRNPVEQMLRLSVPGFVGSRPRLLERPFQDQPGFFDYLRDERGLTESSVRHYEHRLRQFEKYLHSIGCGELAELSPPIIGGFLMERGGSLKKTGIRDACGVLRVFLRYLYREGAVPADLSGAVDAPKTYRFSGVPRSITWDEVRKVLSVVDRRTPLGRRDYAILLLLVTYGLRAQEIAKLTLEDIDWEKERLYVPERKASHSAAYPLSPVVGKAILDYLRNGRPSTTELRQVFLRVHAPHRAIGHNAVSCRATRYIRLAGISVPRPGSHTLRHTCVQRLVEGEFSLKEIGDYVGHRSPDSTKIYTKVDVEALREVALGAGEEVL